MIFILFLYFVYYNKMNFEMREQIINFNKNPKKNSTRLKRMKKQIALIDERLRFNGYIYLNNIELQKCMIEMDILKYNLEKNGFTFVF